MDESANGEKRVWERGGPSPNPSGRPKGIVDKRMKLSKLLVDDAHAIARVVIDKALEGDVQACALVLSRVAPVLRAQAERVSFAFDSNAPLSDQVAMVLDAIAGGEVAPDMGRQIIECISSLAGIRQIDELERRLAALEGER